MITVNADGSISVTLPVTPVSGLPSVPVPLGNLPASGYTSLPAVTVSHPELFLQNAVVPVPGTIGAFTTVTLMSARPRNLWG